MQTDLLVVGGGSGGVGAALAAARLGLNTLLVEKADCLGGTSTRGGVNCWEMGTGGTGIPFDLYLRLKRIPGAVAIYSIDRHGCYYKKDKEPYRFPGAITVPDAHLHYIDSLRRYGSRGMAADEAFCRKTWHGVPFEPEALSQQMLKALEETAHCRVMLNTRFEKVEHAGGPVRSVALSNGDVVTAGAYVDSTGDGLLCVAAGCEEMFGQEPRDRFDEPSAAAVAGRHVNGVTLHLSGAAASGPGDCPAARRHAARMLVGQGFPGDQREHVSVRGSEHQHAAHDGRGRVPPARTTTPPMPSAVAG